MRNLNKKKQTVIMGLLILLLLLLAFDVRLKTVSYTLKSTKIEDPLKLVLITDLHSCRYGQDQKTLIEAIHDQNPDVILLAGDIFDDVLPHDNTELLLQAIGSTYPCYYVSGNHEYWSNEIHEIKALLRRYGVTVLEGTTETLTIKGQTIRIAGIDDPYAKQYEGLSSRVTSQLSAVGNNVLEDTFTVLMSHRPELIDQFRQYPFDLVVAGHAHGGQWRLPLFINGLLAPNQGWFPKYAGGYYDFEELDMIVSRGLARETTRVPRIFNRPELIVINLSAE